MSGPQVDSPPKERKASVSSLDIRKSVIKEARKPICVLVAAFVWACLFLIPIFPSDLYTQQKCTAMMAFCAILWATEALPLWVTSLSIPLQVVVFRLLLDGEGDPLSAKATAVRALGSLASSNVVLLMGGFSVASALHKYHLDSRLASFILSRSSRKTNLFILTLMVVSYTLSMFVNNVAAPVLMLFLVRPLLHSLSQQSRFCRCIVLSIAFACNLGGIPTPIASPQNAAALNAIESTSDENGRKISVSFVYWMGFTIGPSTLLLLGTWVTLLCYWRPEVPLMPDLSEVLKVDKEFKMTARHWLVAGVALGTVGLWCSFEALKEVFGTLGVVSLLPIIILYGSKTLDVEDFKKLDWGVLMLLGGGGALGDAVQSSGLLTTVANCLQGAFEKSDLWLEFMTFNVVVMVISNFVSHTVAALAMMPVVAEVGNSIGAAYCQKFVIGSVFMDSSASMLPVSSFPNVISYGLTDESGKPYLTVKDYAVVGLVVQLMGLILVGSLGWLLVLYF